MVALNYCLLEGSHMKRLLLAFVVLVGALPCTAQEKLSREDTAAILFSNRFSFTDEGEPELSIRIMEEQDSIRFSASKGVLFHPSGPGGPSTRVEGKSTWTARAVNAEPAQLGYRAVVQSLPTKKFQEVREAAARWKEAGLETERIELGTLFSFEGTVLDSRETLLCANQMFDSRKEAARFVDKLTKRHKGKEFRVVQVLAKRPEGEIRIKQGHKSISISARNAVWFEPIGKELTVYDVEYAKGFRWHGRKTRRYGGSFFLAVDKQGKLSISNVLPAEKLLQGLVPAEIYPDSPSEALKAQAIAARNELFSKIGHRHLADPFLICGDQHCQVYKGLNAERENTSRAVRRTRGKVIFDADGKLADIRYHSTCGGHTENAWEAWPGINSGNLVGRWDSSRKEPFTPVTNDNVKSFLENPPKAFCGRSPKGKSTFRWTREIKAKAMTGLVNKKLGVGKVTGIEVLHRGVSGRVNKIRISGAKGTAELSGELSIRRLFGGLKSSLFIVSPVKTREGAVLSWRFSGGGFGHGVGMCQLGAAEMAKDGYSVKEILKFYYKGISVKRIY